MKTSRFSDSQIIAILKQSEAVTPAPELCREHCISSATFYKWRTTFGGMDASLMTRLRELEEENRRLKKCTPKSALKPKSSRKPWQKSGEAIATTRDGAASGSFRSVQYQVGVACFQSQPHVLSPSAAFGA